MQTLTTVRKFVELGTEAYAVGRAYGRRYVRVPQQKSEGMKRVGDLVKKVTFAGFPRRHGVWDMRISSFSSGGDDISIFT
jgi:hypothetical protein